MANYKLVRYGSSGSDVKELQNLLNKNGYNLDEDGIFGANTRAAVQDYQKNNSLSVNGIASDDTGGKLIEVENSIPKQPGTQLNILNPTTAPEYSEYAPSDAVKAAEELLKQHEGKKPGEYESTWQSQLNELMDKILNREEFSYDLNGDALYQQYKNQYVQQGKMAMMDTIGQAQAMTGGYGNSYAQNAGQQAYQAHLQGLNDKVPELYQLALSKYQMEGNEMYKQADIVAHREDQDYSRYRDLYGDWQSERDYLTGRYDYERDFDYGRYADDRDFDYRRERDKVEDDRWREEFEENRRRYEEEKKKKSGSSGGSSSSRSAVIATNPSNPSNPGNPSDSDNSETIKDEPKRDFKWVGQQLNKYIANGATRSQCEQFLAQALSAGYITRAQYTSLKNTFVPRGYTY